MFIILLTAIINVQYAVMLRLFQKKVSMNLTACSYREEYPSRRRQNRYLSNPTRHNYQIPNRRGNKERERESQEQTIIYNGYFNNSSRFRFKK